MTTKSRTISELAAEMAEHVGDVEHSVLRGWLETIEGTVAEMDGLYRTLAAVNPWHPNNDFTTTTCVHCGATRPYAAIYEQIDAHAHGCLTATAVEYVNANPKESHACAPTT